MPTSHCDALFQPIRLGALPLRHRIFMPPLTRSRAGEGNVPNDLMRRYYEQRTTEGGLIIVEATQISPLGQGYLATPGIHSDAQVAGWKQITDAVHAKGGQIVLQLWHVGRISHPYFHGQQPVAPSAIAPRNLMAYTEGREEPIPVPRALEREEIPGIIADYAKAAENAKRAGFDGVEVHGANGYLLDQFLEDGTNQRSDEYGGSIENRARLLLEVTRAVVDVWGADRVGVRLSPGGTFNDMYDSTPQATFGYVIRELNRLGLAYLHLIEATVQDGEHPQPDLSSKYFRPLFAGPLLVAGGYDPVRGCRVVETGVADLVGFGKLFIANPDLVSRLRQGAPLNDWDAGTFYGGGGQGYLDYPTLDGGSAA